MSDIQQFDDALADYAKACNESVSATRMGDARRRVRDLHVAALLSASKPAVAQGADLAALGDLCDDLFSNAANTDLSSGTRAFSNVVALRLSKIIDRAASPAAPAQSAEPGSSCDPADNCADCRCRYNTYAAPQAAQTERALTDEQIDRAIVAWFDDHGFEHDFGRRMRNAFLAAQPASGDDKC